jgi:hypothetical protein
MRARCRFAYRQSRTTSPRERRRVRSTRSADTCACVRAGTPPAPRPAALRIVPRSQ